MQQHVGISHYTNRAQAGELLAKHLERFRGEKPFVLALPRGGVPVAAKVASALNAPLDVMVVRKIGAPHHEEYAIGAIAPGQAGMIQVLNAGAVRSVGATTDQVTQVIARETAEIHRRQLRYRGSSEPLNLQGHSVLLVDDGLATGMTATAAARAVKSYGASRIILAVPVAAPSTVHALKQEVDEIVAPLQPPSLRAIGLHYEDFSQTDDEQVVQLLAEAKIRDAARNTKLSEKPHTLEAKMNTTPDARVRVEDGSYLRSLLEFPPPGGRVSGCVVFVHGSGSGMESPRNRVVAETLRKAGLATFLVDLLTDTESQQDAITRQHRFNIKLLCHRAVACIDVLSNIPTFQGLPIMLVGSSTGAAAALMAAAIRPNVVGAVVSRGGRPDLAGDSLPLVRAPTLLIVGSLDQDVLDLNQQAMKQIKCPVRLEVVPHATHLFPEPGTLEKAAQLTAQFLELHAQGQLTNTQAKQAKHTNQE